MSSRLHLLTPNWQSFLLPPLSPLATTSLFSVSVSLFLFCRSIHLRIDNFSIEGLRARAGGFCIPFHIPAFSSKVVLRMLFSLSMWAWVLLSVGERGLGRKSSTRLPGTCIHQSPRTPGNQTHACEHSVVRHWGESLRNKILETHWPG